MVSAWALLSIVPLIASNWYAVKQIEKLRGALEVREMLCERPVHDAAAICANGVMVLTIKDYVGRIRIWSRYEARLRLEFEDA